MDVKGVVTRSDQSSVCGLFTGADEVNVMLPRDGAALGDAGPQALAELGALLRRERAELELELGAPVRFTDDDPGTGPRWLIGPGACNPARDSCSGRYCRHGDGQIGLWLDRGRQVLVADAPNLDGIRETFNLLRTLRMSGAETVMASDCATLDEAISRIVTEVGYTYPSFGLRRLDWDAMRARHADRVRAAADPLAAMQEWLAELHDAHTWVRARPAPVPLPYHAWVDPASATATMTRVPPRTAAWDAGARPGNALIGVDAAGWWARTAAPAHMRPLLAGYRLLSGPVGMAREFMARAPNGQVHTWTEAPTLEPAYPLVSWKRLPSGSGYLRIEAWRADLGVDAAIDAAFDELADSERLIVDLRGNVGGNATLALSFRDRFLRQRTTLGSVRFSDGMGGLTAPAPIVGEPAPAQRRWRGAVRFLTDPLTYSASEDALLGLQGLPHVGIVGEPSGGGSGRPRAVRLLPNLTLGVSAALTYDRQGRCVEGAGIPVDRPVTPDRFSPDAPDVVLLAADGDW